MQIFLYILGLIVVAFACLGLVALMQKLQARKVRYWQEKRSYELKLADELEEELKGLRSGEGEAPGSGRPGR